MHLGEWRNKLEEFLVFVRSSLNSGYIVFMLQRKKLSVPAQKRDFFYSAWPGIKSLYILGKDKISLKNDIWSIIFHFLVSPHDSKCQTKSLFSSHETTSGIKVPETNCISVHENPLFLLINLLYLKAELVFLSYWEKTMGKLTATVMAVKATKKVSALHTCTAPAGNNAFGAVYI